MWSASAKGILSVLIVAQLFGFQTTCEGSHLMTFPLFRPNPFMDTFELGLLDPFFCDPFDIDFFNREIDMLDFEDSFLPIRCLPKMTKYEPLTSQTGTKLVLDVRGFAPEELSLTVTNNDLVVSGEHKCADKRKGCLERRVFWRQTLPKDMDPDSVNARLARNGDLVIEANKTPKPIGGIKKNRIAGEDTNTARNEASTTKTTSTAKTVSNTAVNETIEDDVTVEVVPESESPIS